MSLADFLDLAGFLDFVEFAFRVDDLIHDDVYSFPWRETYGSEDSGEETSSYDSEVSERTSPEKKKHLPQSASQNKSVKLALPVAASSSTQRTLASTKLQGISKRKPGGSPHLGKKQKPKETGNQTSSSRSVTSLPSTSKATSKFAVKSQAPATKAAAGTGARTECGSSFKKPQAIARGTKVSALVKSPKQSKQTLRARVPPVQKAQNARRSLGKKSATSTQRTQAKVQVAKKPRGRPSLAQAKAQAAKITLERKSTTQKQAKLSISRKSLGRTSAVKPCPVVKSPVRNLSTVGSASSSRHSAVKQVLKGAPSTKVNIARKSNLKSSSKAQDKTPSGTLKHGSEMCSPPRSGVKPQSPPSSSRAKFVPNSARHVACSTPCSVVIQKTAARSPSTAPKATSRNSSSNSSSGSTPFHTAHSICLSSSSEASTSSSAKSTKMFAGETPYRQKRSSASFKSATESPAKKASPQKTEVPVEGESDEEKLNGTFTMVESPMVSPKRPSSRLKKLPQPHSSCLRKGTSTSLVKKSVSFTVPGRRSATPKRLPKTPRRSRTLHETLKDWLGARGYSLSALRQSHQDNMAKQQTPRKPRRSSGKPLRAALRSSENQALGASPVLQKPVKRSLTPETKTDNVIASKHASIPSVLTDIQQCLGEPNPPEDIETWLDQLEEHVPSVTEYSTYWLCRCLCYKMAGNLTEAMRSLSAGLEFVTTGHRELADALDNFTKRTSEKEPKAVHDSPSPSQKRKSKASTSPRKKRKNLEVVTTGNIFDSTIIDYKVYEEPSLKRLSAAIHGKESASVAVMTPVRRSSRHSKRFSSVVSPRNLLYKSNPALQDE